MAGFKRNWMGLLLEFVSIEISNKKVGDDDMADEVQTLVGRIEKKAMEKAEKSIICALLETLSIDVVSDLIHKEKSEIIRIISEAD